MPSLPVSRIHSTSVTRTNFRHPRPGAAEQRHASVCLFASCQTPRQTEHIAESVVDVILRAPPPPLRAGNVVTYILAVLTPCISKPQPLLPLAMPGNTEHNDTSSPLDLLVQDLGDQTKSFTGYLRAHGLPKPSFGRDVPVSRLPAGASEEVLAARDKILDSALQIFRLVSGPRDHLFHSVAGVSASTGVPAPIPQFSNLFRLVPTFGNPAMDEQLWHF